MSTWLDISYLKQISSRLDGYKEKKVSPFAAVCRCPICGDSTKKRNKKRGNFYSSTKDNNLHYRCFNCNAGMYFSTFLKEFDVNLYNKYRFDKFKKDVVDDVKPTPPETKNFVPDVTSDLDSIASLDLDHPARIYLSQRKIPDKFYDKIFYVEKFYEWASGHTDKFSVVSLNFDHPRIVIPWYSEDGVCFAYHARSLYGQSPKYYSVVIDDTYPKFYGLDRIDRNKTVYVVEGPVDSMFIDNCVAVGNSAIGQFDYKWLDTVYIPDRDVRNPQIMKIVRKLIDNGKKVCLLPLSLPDKDINGCIQEGLSVSDLKNIIETNTISGLTASLAFTNWSKVNETEKRRSFVKDN